MSRMTTQISMFELDNRNDGAFKVYSVEVQRSGSQFYSVNVGADHGKIVDYSGISGDLPESVVYFLKGQGFDVSDYE